MTSDDSPLYRLVDEDSKDALLVATEVHGFFVTSNRGESDKITFQGVPVTYHPRRGVVDDVELQVIDRQGEVIGSYYIGRARVDTVSPSLRRDSVTDVTASFFGYTCEYPRAGQIWRRWASGKPVEIDEWRRHSTNSRPSWLHVVQNAWFTSGHAAARYGRDETVMINGGGLPDVHSFFCAIGEAVNGAGGYFGSNLTSFADCLSQSANSGTRFEIIWDDYATSRRLLGEEFTASVAGIMREFDVSLVRR